MSEKMSPRETGSTVLEARNISKRYVSKRLFGTARTVQALNDVSFTLTKGKCLGIVGESGCGKSTLCRMLCGIETPDQGNILLNGLQMGENASWRSDIQMVFQNSLDAIDPRYTASDIIAEPLVNFTDLRGKALAERLRKLMVLVGLPPEDLEKKGRQFSGGQLQRICIARALAVQPKVVILDEPLSSLDVSVQAQILNLLRRIKEKTEVSYIIISHDIEAIYYLADSLVVMYAGQIMESLEDIREIRSLRHPYSRHLMMPFESRGDIEQDRLEEEDGNEGCAYYSRCTESLPECRKGTVDFQQAGPGHLLRCVQCIAGK